MPHTDPFPTPDDMILLRSWCDGFKDSPSRLPFSFTLDGVKVAGIPDDWSPTATARRIDATMVETLFQGTDPRTGLDVRVEYLEYSDSPVTEWTVWLTNTGTRPTPLIEDIRGLDAAFGGGSPMLNHCNGDYCNVDGYTPTDSALVEGEPLTFAPSGGRPCDRAFPYFRLAFAGCGLTLSVGWPAQWSASFARTGERVAITAGQELTSLVLQPGERIRTPRITVQSWVGDTTRAVNLWRRWYLAHVLPRPDGQPLAPVMAAAATDEGEEFTGATEENQIRYQQMWSDRGLDFDVWWIDAGWYPCKDENGVRRWPRTGTWIPDPERFPNGLGPIAANARRLGAKLLLWFEPERVTEGSRLFDERPEWLLKNNEPDRNALLNLGDTACREWLTDYICDTIRDNGIGIYRQDYNFAPLKFWRCNDAPDRQGMNENLYVQGYLQYWDDLLRRNPGLWIDSCASGGRRNDLETLRRSVPLHYTDHGYGDHGTKLAFHHTLHGWIPYFREMTVSWDETAKARGINGGTDSFSFHCAMGSMLSPALDIREETTDFATVRQMVAVWRQAAPILLHGDYYPLTPFSKATDSWVAWQFHRPELGMGVVQALRHVDAPDGAFTARLSGLKSDALYALSNPETGETAQVGGDELMNAGLSIALPARAGAVWMYREV